MALVECKECKAKISTAAIACPHCGVPLPAASQDQINDIIKQGIFMRQRWFAGWAFFGGLGWLFLSAMTGGAESFSANLTGASWIIGAGLLWYVLAEIDRNLYERKRKRAAQN